MGTPVYTFFTYYKRWSKFFHHNFQYGKNVAFDFSCYRHWKNIYDENNNFKEKMLSYTFKFAIKALVNLLAL